MRISDWSSDVCSSDLLMKLAQHIDRKMAELEAGIGQVGEQRLLFMSCLLIADELFDAQRQVDGLKAGRISPQSAGAPAQAGPAGEAQATRARDAGAQRTEAIAARLQGASIETPHKALGGPSGCSRERHTRDQQH